MDLFSFGFVLLIVAVGGVIGYVADKLGKKLGKKRLSLWGLRPRHVAELGTVLMGVVVAALTIALVAAADSNAREWLKEGQGLVIQRDNLLKDIAKLKTGNESLQQESVRLSTTNHDLDSKNIDLAKTNRELVKSRDAERASLEEAQTQKLAIAADKARLELLRDQLSGQIAGLHKSLNATQLALDRSRTDLSRSKFVLQQTRTTLKGYQADIRQAEKELRTSNHNTEVANKKADDALKKNLEFYQKSIDVQTQITALENQMSVLATARKAAERDLAIVQDRYATTQSQLAAASKDLDDTMTIVQSQRQLMADSLRSSRTEALTFRSHEEVARFTVAGGASLGTARSALTSLIRAARVEALNRGAKAHRNKNQVYEVADVFDRQDPTTDSVVSGDELKDAVVARVAGRVEPQVLVARSSYNAFAGEPVSLEISVLSNPIIYHHGEMLSEARIDGSQSEDRIYAQLSDFLKTRVRERASDDGMIPRAGTDAPFGEVSVLDVLNVVRDVKKVGRTVRVQAFAGSDIRAAESLRLEFRLR